MQYAILIYDKPESFANVTPEQGAAVMAEYMAIAQAPGVKAGERLGGVETATTVRVQNGATLVTDGPFADTKEVFGGYFVFESDNIDAAIAFAARIPAARMGGSIEVRPIVAM
jgi:hypothetical protein